MDLDKLSMYTLKETCRIEDINSVGYFFVHNKSQAKICVISNDDENKVFTVGFRTPPENNTGLPHILEHSVLCGSRHFPAKDPFVELAKGSLNTFLNAMTYPDRTVYPLASCNDQDFKNLMHVYMDAVFYPNIYTNERILQQEGWHYELADESSELTINGVVYNEMKGAYSLPEGVLERESLKLLFPDTPYANDSGGLPEEIPQLTQEEFTAFHKKYYHPSNSYIYLYGDMDVEERLLWLDREYLTAFKSIDIDSQIPSQSAFEHAKEEESLYPIGSEESEEDNTYLCSYQVVGGPSDYELQAAFRVLEYVLITAPGAPVKQALTDAKIGKDILGGYEKDVKQPIFSIIAKNANVTSKDAFLTIIDRVLREQVENGLDKKALAAALHSMDFSYREADYGRYPRGLMYGLNLIGAWIYDDTRVPFESLEMLSIYKKLNEKADTDYFEQLIMKYLLKNTHKLILVMKPKKGLNAQADRALKEELAAYKASLDEKALKELVIRTAELKKYQQEPSSKEDLSSIPMLKRSDMRREILPLNNTHTDICGIPVLLHDYQTNGIGYLDILFDIKDIDPKYLGYLALLKNVLMFVDTDNYNYRDLFNEIQCSSGGMSFNTMTYDIAGEKKNYGSKFVFSVKAVYKDYEKVFALLSEIICSSHMDNTDRLYEIIAEQKSQLQMGILSSGHLFSMMRSSANYSESSYVEDMFSGIGYYDFIKDNEENFEERKDQLTETLNKLVHMIFDPSKMLLSFTGQDEGIEEIKRLMPELKNNLHKNCSQAFESGSFALRKLNEGFRCASKVQYVAQTGDFSAVSTKKHGVLNVVATMMRYDYLWNEIRVLGGAYGCMNGYGRTGKGYFISYRDPHLKRTLKVYEGAAEYLRAFDGSEDEITRYIIGTLSDLDTPLSESKKGNRSMMAWLSGINEEIIAEERKEVLDIRKEDINQMGDYIEKIIADHHLCVIGSEEKIDENAGLFDVVRTL